MGEPNLLGEYLRARRELIQPADVGLPGGENRRVKGLRREEVALLAGVSADYYLRLEQGRDRNPSLAVLDSLAHALVLDETATDHLLSLAASSSPSARRRLSRSPSVPTGIAALLQTIGLPAFVEDMHLDILIANDLAVALSPTFRAGQNRLRSMFLDPAERSMFVDWEATTARLVAAFRVSVGHAAHDARTVELVGELSSSSPWFRRLWARHDVQARVGMPPMKLRHPQLGELTLLHEKLIIDETDGQVVAVWHAEPNSVSADKLGMLASLASPTTDAPPEL